MTKKNIIEISFFIGTIIMIALFLTFMAAFIANVAFPLLDKITAGWCDSIMLWLWG